MTDSTEHLARRCRAAWSVEYGMKVVPPWERLSEQVRRAWMAVAKVMAQEEGR